MEVYLRDHFAGATAGLALARRCRRNNAGTGLDAELAGIETEIDEDRRRLQAMMSRLGVAPSPLKSTLGSFAELVGRLKGNGRIVRPSPVSPVVELEGLAAGIVTKRNLWRSLRVAAPNHGGLDIAELDLLEERATSQLARVTTAHDRAAEGAFGPPVRSVTASELAS